MLKVYPEQAFRWSVSGEAVIDCAVTSDGHLEGCAVASESPQGAGFGEAAVKLGRKFQMDLGAASGGGHVQIPIHFNISN